MSEFEGVTERRVQDALWRDLFSGHLLVCPNYTPHRWYECDLYAVTKAGYAVEHEIKLSVADYRADAKKNEHRFVGWEGNKPLYETRTKHARLAARDIQGPSRFWYVMPESMVAPEEIPEWAGMKTFKVYHDPPYTPRVRGLTIAKEAPILHRQKVADATLDHLRGIFYYRYWHQRVQIPDAELADDSKPLPVGLEVA